MTTTRHRKGLIRSLGLNSNRLTRENVRLLNCLSKLIHIKNKQFSWRISTTSCLLRMVSVRILWSVALVQLSR